MLYTAAAAAAVDFVRFIFWGGSEYLWVGWTLRLGLSCLSTFLSRWFGVAGAALGDSV